MLCNSSITIYHYDGLDVVNHFEKWKRINYGTKEENTVWFHGGKGAGINKGYENANDFTCRIWYEKNPKLCISDFAIGDIVVNDALDFDIQTQQDLKDYLVYNIQSITDEKNGLSQHIYIGGK